MLSNQQLEAVLRPLWRPCLSVDDVNTLLRAITDSYVQAGYPASRPYLAHRPQAGKPPAIVIVEGFVESIELAGTDLPLSLRGAFPDLLGQPLYLPALEQGLDQLNRLRAYDLNADLLPGEIQSGTRVVIQPRRTGSRWHLDSRLDNRGSDLTGRHRLNLGLGLDSPLGLNDDLRLGSATTGQRRQNTTVENDSTAVRSELLAKGDLTLSTANLASDAARVEAGGTLQVNAGQIDNRAVEDLKERKQDATDWRAGLGASLEYRDLTRPSAWMPGATYAWTPVPGRTSMAAAQVREALWIKRKPSSPHALAGCSANKASRSSSQARASMKARASMQATAPSAPRVPAA